MATTVEMLIYTYKRGEAENLEYGRKSGAADVL